MALIPDCGNSDTKDDVTDVPMPTICSPFHQDQVYTRSLSGWLIEGLRSVLVKASSPGTRAGLTNTVLGDKDRDDMDLEETTVPLRAAHSTSMSVSSSTRHSREDVGRPATLSGISVARSPHSVSSTAIPSSNLAPIFTVFASTQAQLLSSKEAFRRAQDRSEPPVFTFISKDVERRSTGKEDCYRALRSHQLLTQHAAAAGGGSTLHSLYWQDQLVNSDKFQDREFLVSPHMMKLLGYPTLLMLKSDDTLHSVDDTLRVGVAHGCVYSADRRPRGHGPAFIKTANVASRHVSIYNISLPRKLEGLVERTLSDDYRCAFNRSPVEASRSLASAHRPQHSPGGVIPFRRVDAARCLRVAWCRQDGINPVMTIPVSSLHCLYLDIEHRCLQAGHCPPPVGGVLYLVPPALHRMHVCLLLVRVYSPPPPSLVSRLIGVS